MSKVRIQRISGEELGRRLFSGDLSKRNSDYSDRLKYLHPNELIREEHFMSLRGDLITGVLSFQVSPYDDRSLWLKHIVIDERFRNQGIATALIRSAFSEIESGRVFGRTRIERSSPSSDGQAYLTRLMILMREEHPGIELVDHYSATPDF